MTTAIDLLVKKMGCVESNPMTEKMDQYFQRQQAGSHTIEQTAPNPSVELDTLLDDFESHGLDDLNNANLMSRVDSKFILPMSFLPVLLKEISDHYSVLKIADKRVFAYHNYYFDTPEMHFYHDHHNGKLNRFKVRHRSYLDTDTQFLEVKFKNNQKRTIKTRIKLTGVPEDIDLNQYEACSQFISSQTNIKFTDLVINQQGGYSRIALASEQRAERLTLDFDLWFQAQQVNANGHEKVALPGFFIAELKQTKRTKLSPAYQVLTANGYAPTSFSKYCIGCALIYGNSIKSNQFKKTLLRIQQFKLVEPNSHHRSHLND